MIQRRVARSGLLLGSTGSPVSLTASLPLHTCVSDPPHRAVAFLLIELLSVSDNVYFSQASVLVWYLSLTLRLLFGAGLFHGGRRGSEAWLRAAPAGHGDGGIPPGHQKTVSLTHHSVSSIILCIQLCWHRIGWFRITCCCQFLPSLLWRLTHSEMCWSPQNLLFTVCDPSPGEYPVQEEDVPGRLHRHLQPGGASYRLRTPGGQSVRTPHDELSGCEVYDMILLVMWFLLLMCCSSSHSEISLVFCFHQG